MLYLFLARAGGALVFDAFLSNALSLPSWRGASPAPRLFLAMDVNAISQVKQHKEALYEQQHR